ncbi:hypothetical protein KQI76_07085 [Amphibacillus sp. MSJ-3]|uniref:hypothetical protein n=1 Tax=Amphibacillus sp. MSJ-3 TaxID=2841505 RepID=UPI001C0EF145|nr:hypothetical protein [Amphibacillus sp. MSJ-3]MBU5594925.1 hypothetical protein [Amphibacillus sp. MSJ-3]
MILYLIEHNGDKHLVEAENQIVAIGAWINEEKQRKRDFKPNDFSVQKIKTKYGLIQVPS